MGKRQDHKNEILENPEAIREKLFEAEGWFEQNSKILVAVAVVAAVAVAGFFGWQYYKDSQNEKAQQEMFQAVYYFEADSLEQALNGDANNLGFLDIIEEYGMTEAANLSNYYAGVIYLKQGKFGAAREYLSDFKSNDLLIQARAYSLVGDSYMEEKNFSEAAKAYNKAANYKPNKFFSPVYLMKEALAYEKANDTAKAVETYDKVINQYWDSSEYQKARKFKARLQANS